MEIYLVRHGIAAVKRTYAEDSQRPLTKKGIDKTTEVAKKLSDMGITFKHLLSSPKVRAYQTAEILKNVGLCPEIAIHEPLTQGGDIQLWLEWLSNNYNEEHKIALVGHEPDLTNWAEMLIFGSINDKFILKKAGIIGIKILNKTEPIGNSELFLLTSHKWFV